MSIKINIRDGEANLIKKVFENISLDKVIQEALNLNLEAQSLRIDRIAKDGPWISTEKSTDILPVLYFEGENNQNYLISQKQGEKKYGLFEYRWMP